MAFKVYSTGIMATAPLVKLPSTASETYTIGEALVLTTGALTACGATATPTFICNEAYVAPASANKDISAYRVRPDMIFETTNSASLNSVNIGDKVTLASGSLQVTATTSSGVAEVVSKIAGTGTGNLTLVRF